MEILDSPALLIYLIIEITSLIATKMLMIHKLLVILRIYLQLKKLTPKHWTFKSRWFLIALFSLNRISKRRYSFYIEFTSLVKTDKFLTPLLFPKFSNDFVEVDFFGKFVKYSFTDEMDKKDELMKDEVKQQKREDLLKDLGL